MKNKIFISPSVCYNHDMPQNAEKKSEAVLVNLSPTQDAELNQVAAFEDRKRGYIVRELYLRGLALYRIDGCLRDEATPGVKSATVTLNSKIAGRIEPGRKTAQRMIDSADISVKRKKRRAG